MTKSKQAGHTSKSLITGIAGLLLLQIQVISWAEPASIDDLFSPAPAENGTTEEAPAAEETTEEAPAAEGAENVEAAATEEAPAAETTTEEAAPAEEVKEEAPAAEATEEAPAAEEKTEEK